MIAEATAAAASRTVFQAAVDRVGEALGPSGPAPPASLDAVLAHFELPDALAQRLTRPFGDLGFSFEVARSTASFPEPPTYTRVSNGRHELAFIHLPPQLFPPTQSSVLVTNGLGYAFVRGTRLHVFSTDLNAMPELIESGMKSWEQANGVNATFHPWLRVTELEEATDKVAFVKRVFSIPANGGPPRANAATELTPPQWRVLHEGLMSAFPSYGELSLAMRLQLGRSLAVISEEAALPGVVEKVIVAANAQGWLQELVRGARDANPGNAKLLEAARQIPPELGGEPA